MAVFFLKGRGVFWERDEDAAGASPSSFGWSRRDIFFFNVILGTLIFRGDCVNVHKKKKFQIKNLLSL